MSLLSVFQRVCNEVGLPEPPLVATSTDRQIKQLLAITYRVGNDLRSKAWPALQKEATITLVDGQASYAFPVDYDYDIAETHWDQDNDWPLYGPMNASEWQALKNGIVNSSTFEKKFRFKGSGLKQFFIDPTPDSGTAGEILVYEYQSLNWFRPKTWTATTLFGAGTYCFYDGYFFKTILGGTTGSTAPTPSGLNDGGVVWAEITAPYSAFTADTDEFIIDEDLVGLGVQWNYLASKGLPYAHLEKKFNDDVNVTLAQSTGGESISLVPSQNFYSPYYRNYRVIP